MNKIKKIEYIRYFFNLYIMEAVIYRTISVSSDGEVVIQDHNPFGKDQMEEYREMVSVEKVETLFEELQTCIISSDSRIKYIDDTYGEVIIFYESGETGRVKDDLGDETDIVKSIIDRFLLLYCQIDERA